MIKKITATHFGVIIECEDGKEIHVSPNENKLFISFDGLGADTRVDARQLAANNVDIYYVPMEP